MRQTATLAQNFLTEVPGTQVTKRLIERQLQEDLNSELFEPMRAGLGIHQAKRWELCAIFLGEKAAGVWLKG